MSSSAGLSYGLNITKKKPLGSRLPPRNQKPIFDDDDDDDPEAEDTEAGGAEEIRELGGIEESPRSNAAQNGTKGSSKAPSSSIGSKKSKKTPLSVYGDLSSAFTSKKHAATAEDLDASIYEYDAVYDSLKPAKKTSIEDQERKPKYMSNLIAAAAIRKRDATIADEKKLAREREAEGEEFADKEKFVTSAYKKQQEENRRLEAEERIREEQEKKLNKGKGMTNFFKQVLDKEGQRHAEVVKAAEEAIARGPETEFSEPGEEKTGAELAREMNRKSGVVIALNDEGQVVDKRQLLQGGLNIQAKTKTSTTSTARGTGLQADRSRGSGFVGAGGGKQAMRERQSRLMEAQLEQATKRALEEEEQERAGVERAAKSRKTEGEIVGAKERYLARKREAEEARRKGEV